jgi:uncharacterized membrane protein
VDEYGDFVDPYVFFQAGNETLVITLDYTVANSVETYSDTAEFYWQIVNNSWSFDSSQVSLTLTLPAPANYSKEDGAIHAWGRGALNGNTEIREDGSLVFYIPNVEAGTFAEAQVLFPVEWMSGMPVEHNREHLQERLDEMALWEARANQERLIANLITMASIVVPLGILAAAFLLFLSKGREYKPRFREKYLREIPSGDHPAVLGAIWNWGEVGTRELIATLMCLTNSGVLYIDKGTHPGGLFGNKQVEDYYIAVDKTKRAALTNPIDTQALDLVFDKVGKGVDSLYFATINQNAKQNAAGFDLGFESWKSTVKTEVTARGFFEKTGNTLSAVYSMFGGIMAVGSAMIAVAAIVAGASTLFLPSVITGGLIMVLGSQMPRRSPEAAELRARCGALRNWLKDFSNLREAVPTDVKVWDHFLVYAVVLDVADKVNEQLAITLPQVHRSPSFRSSRMWVAPVAGVVGGTAAFHSLSGTFSSAVGKSQRHATLSSFGSSSRSGGGGGGFSGGGGGGFGGGGGSRGSGAR